jgi:CIC family chloride channel protein
LIASLFGCGGPGARLGGKISESRASEAALPFRTPLTSHFAHLRTSRTAIRDLSGQPTAAGGGTGSPLSAIRLSYIPMTIRLDEHRQLAEGGEAAPSRLMRIRRRAIRVAGVSLLGVVVGAPAAFAAIAFVEAVLWLNELLLVSAYARVQYAETPLLLSFAVLAVPTLGGLVVGLIVQYLIKERRGLGPADAILAVQIRQRLPSAKSGLASSLAALVSLGCGASVGQYGPLVYLGALVGSLAAPLERRMRDLGGIAIACGVAAAIATAFNAPIAGLVFAHEVLLRHYSMRAFAPVAVAAATGFFVDNIVFDRSPLLLVDFEGVGHGHEFLLFALLGLLSALLALAYMHALLLGNRLGARIRLPPPLKTATAGLAVGVMAMWVPEILGIGLETLRFATIEGAFEIDELVVLITAKIVATALCLGLGFVGGVFSPALLIGVLGGTLYGMTAAALLPVELSGVVPYAICGMMAVTSPVIGAPLTTILIVFELTRNYDLTIAAMVAVVLSNLVSYRAFGRSLFDVQLLRRDVDLSLGRDMAVLGNRPVSRFMLPAPLVLGSTDCVADLLAGLGKVQLAEAVLTDADGHFVGMLRLQDAVTRPPATPLGEIARDSGIVFGEATTLWDAIGRLRDIEGSVVPVVGDDGRPLGLVSKAAVIDAYLDAVNDLRREENAA